MRYQRVKNVAWRRIGDETVIVNLERRRMLAVNDAGSAVWNALAGEVAAPAAATVLSGGADAESGDDVIRFLADLEMEGVVELSTVDSAAGGSLPPLAGVPPVVVWREELHRFGGGCGMLPGQNPLCDAGPFGS